jgi:hypothetical protein
MNNVLCRVFGHKPPAYSAGRGWGGGEYAKVRLAGRDGIGRQHADVFGECSRCAKTFWVCRVHVPAPPHAAGEAPHETE